MYPPTEESLHQLARLFMGQFNFKQRSLDEYLAIHGEEMTDDERNLGLHILSMFETLNSKNSLGIVYLN